MALARLSLQASNRTAMHFIQGWREEEIFDFDAPYQRGHVWNIDQKVALIRSMLLGIPIGAVVTNFRGNYGPAPYYRVIDGKQRIQAMREFYDGSFAIPADWVDEADLPAGHGEYVTRPELSIVFERGFHMLGVAEVQATVKTVEEEAEIFRLINSAGTAQTDIDLARAAAIENQHAEVLAQEKE